MFGFFKKKDPRRNYKKADSSLTAHQKRQAAVNRKGGKKPEKPAPAKKPVKKTPPKRTLAKPDSISFGDRQKAKNSGKPVNKKPPVKAKAAPKKAPVKAKAAPKKPPVKATNPRASQARTSANSKTNRDYDAAPGGTNSNPRARSQSITRDVTGGVKTKAGTYKTFKKTSVAAKSFRSAFAAARKEGYKTFKWNGKKYTTETK